LEDALESIAAVLSFKDPSIRANGSMWTGDFVRKAP